MGTVRCSVQGGPPLLVRSVRRVSFDVEKPIDGNVTDGGRAQQIGLEVQPCVAENSGACAWRSIK
jgi:hypothetical protein